MYHVYEFEKMGYLPLNHVEELVHITILMSLIQLYHAKYLQLSLSMSEIPLISLHGIHQLHIHQLLYRPLLLQLGLTILPSSVQVLPLLLLQIYD
jgi:hypothetical protein